MHPSGTPLARPRPPGRAASKVALAAPGPSAPTLSLPADTPPRQLRSKLSSSSLSMSLPPDSPPMTFDSLPNLGSPASSHRHDQSSTGRSTRDLDSTQPAFVPFPVKLYPSTLSASSASTLLLLPGGRARTLSMARARLAETVGTGAAQEGPPLDSEWLETKTRGELEALLTEADRVIRERTRDLEAAASVGKFLLEENNLLRTRHDSLATRSPGRGHTRGGPASPIASRTWRTSLGFPPPAVFALRSARPSLPADDSDPDEAPRSNPTTPVKLSRHRTVSSATSVGSLFAPSPRNNYASSPTSQQIAMLDQANYVLHLQLTELEADAEKQERLGKKKLKKLEKEIAALRDDLDRAEERNDALEEEKIEASGASAGEGKGRGGTPDGRGSRNAPVVRGGDGTPTPTKPTRALDQDHDDGAPGFAPLESSHTTPKSSFTSSMDTPTNARRTPGNGLGTVDPLAQRKSRATSGGSKTPDEQQDEIVTQLVAKIDELREENDAIKDQRVEMVQRWDQAQRDLDEYRRRCEEMEEFAEIEWGDRKGAIGWTNDEQRDTNDEQRDTNDEQRDTNDEQRQTRLKGNQRSIRSRHNHRSVAPSEQSESSSRSGSPTPNYGRRSVSGALSLASAQKRTLGSELGSQWEGEDAYGDGSGDEDTQGDEDEEGETEEGDRSTVSTSTPSRFRAPHMDYMLDHRDPTLAELIPSGSLRYSGPPDSITYERISQAVAEAPVVWEAEDDFGVPPLRPSRGLLKNIKWAPEVEDDPWEASRYPEPEEPSVPMIESRQDVEERRREGRRTAGTRRRRHRRPDGMLGDDKRSRRDQALRRLGLPLDFSRNESDDDFPRRDDSSYGDDGDDISEFEFLQSADNRQRGDYYPVSLRARYAPRAMASWAADSALTHVVNIVLYLKLFVVLGFAVIFALWQGPKQTMGVVERRRLR